MEPWILVTLAAAAVQTLRLLLQKRLKGLGLSTGGATFARFFFNAPLVIGGLLALHLAGGYRLARAADVTTIAEIVHAVDEPLRATRCEKAGQG